MRSEPTPYIHRTVPAGVRNTERQICWKWPGMLATPDRIARFTQIEASGDFGSAELLYRSWIGHPVEDLASFTVFATELRRRSQG